MLKQVKQEDIIKASQERDQQRQNAYRSTSQAANNKKSGISTAKTRTTTQKKTTSKSKSKFSDSPLFTAAKKFLSANDDAAEMTYGVYNPKASERTRAGNTLGAAGKSYQAGQANALAFLLGQDQDKVDKTRADARKYMIEHGYAKASDFGESKTDKWLAEQSGKLTDSARRLNAEAAEHEAAAKQGLGKAGQTLVDVGIAGSQMLLDAGVGALTGTGMLSMGSRTFGQATREALDNGATRGQAALYGAGSAAVEVGTEKLFDAVKLFGGGATDDLLEAAVRKLAKTDAGRTALRAVGNMGGEAVEELISGIVNPVLRASYDPNAMKDYKTREYWTDNLHDALVGAILGAAGAGGSIITGQNAVNNAALRQQETAQAAQAEAQRMAEYNQRQQRQRDYFAGNTMQTGTADAEAANILNRNAQARGEITPNMIAEVVKATPDPTRAAQNIQAMQTRQAEQNATQATPAASNGIQELETVKQALGKNPTFDDLINYYSQQGESGVEAYQRIAGAFERGELVDGGNSGIYTRAEIEQRQTSMPEADHIDNRTPEYNSKVSTKPFQLTHPELHPYFAEAAKALQQEAVNSFMSDMPNLKGGKVYNISVGLKRVMDMTGLSRQQISECCQDIIDNHGAENYASAKHVEAALDYIMTNGAQFQNAHFDSNPAYMEAKGKITGGTDPNTFDYALEHEYGDLIAMEEMTVDEARADWERNHPQQTPANQANAAFAEQTPANQANAAFAEQTPANQANAEPAVTPESSVGAAQEGYDPYSAWQNQSDEFHPDSANGVRQVDLPTENLQGQKTMRGGRTVMEARATPENRVRELEQLYVDGHLAYVPVNNEQLARDAQAAIGANGENWQRCLDDWTVAVRSGQTSPQIVAMGATLLNNAGNSNASAETYLGIVQDYVNLTSGTAQALQATRILQSLTPQSVVYMMGRTERQMNDQLNNTRRGRRENRRNREDAERQVEEITRQRDDALNLIREIGEAFREEETGEQLTWQQQLSQELEEHVLASQNANRTTRTPSGTIMIRDLYRFADDLIQRPQGETRQRRTATDRLADYFANRAEYDAAWEQAQQAAREQYGNDPEAMARMQPFLESGVSTNNGNASRTALSAVAEAAAAEEISRRDAAMRYQYGDMASLTNQIVNRITQTVPIETDADLNEIYNAVSEYLQNNITQRNARGDLVNGDRMMPEMRRSLREFGLRMSDIIREGAQTKGQVADLIAQDMIQRFGVSEDGAQAFAEHVVDAFNMEVASRSESALESMFRERQRSQPRSFGEKLTELANMGAFVNPDYANIATQKLTGDSSLTVSLNPDLVQEYLDAETDAERDNIITEIQKDLARQLPTSWLEKWNALRYLNMLGNLKTQVRNIVGNTTMMLTAKVKREVLAGMEHVAHAVSGGKYERMTSFVVSPELYAAARRDFRNVQKAALDEAKYGDAGGTSKSEFMQGVQEQKRIFNSRVLEAYRKATSWAMEQGDVIFSRATYANAFAGYLKAHGITAEELANNPNSDVIDKGRIYAIKEAQEATFRDNNQFSSWVSKIGRRPDTPWYGRLAAEGIAPFRKTPANVLARAEEYSPLGIINSFVKTFQSANVDSDVTANDAMNSWAKTMTGSAILAAGFMLAKAGHIRGADDDDERQNSFDKLRGQQEYSIIINGKSYTIDTFSPTAMPLLVGAALYDLVESGGLNPKGIESAITSLADPMINMSMLSGVNDAISNVQYADNNLIQLALNSAVGYVTQGLTNTLIGQAERTFEENRMSTYTDEDSNLPAWMQRQLGKASAKTPKWDYNQSEYIDNWGRTQSNGSLAERAFNNFLNPVYVSDISDDATEAELERVAKATGSTSIYPNSMYDIPEMKFDGEARKLTQKEKEKYQKAYGKEYKKLADDLRKTDEYKSLTDAEKNVALSKLEDYAVNAGKKAVGADETDQNWAEHSSGGVTQNAAYYSMYNSASRAAKDATGGTKQADINEQLFSRGYDYDTTINVMAQYMSESTVERYEAAYADGYDFSIANAFVKAYNENDYGYGEDDKKPRGYKKNGTIQWAQDNLGLTQSQANTLYKYMKGN